MVPRRETKSFSRWLARFLLRIAFSLVALAVFYLVIVFRIRIGPVNDAVRVFNKHVLNPTMMFLDRHHWHAPILRHKGRHSA